MMLGLDAVSLPFIRDHREQLPNLSLLLDEGLVRELETPATYLSASVWPTFSSGRPPGEHGQYFPFQWSASDRGYRRVSDPRWSDDFDCEPFWHRIAKAGIATIAFDIAHALHDERAPCLQITNWSYQSSGDAKASNPEVLNDIRRRFGHRPIGSEVPVPKTARQCAQIRDQLVRAARAKGDATLHLMQKPWKLFVAGWYEAHRAGHNLWPVEGDFASDAAPDAMLEVYQEVDRQLGRVREALDRDDANTSLLVFALHGMEANKAQDHFLNEILARLNAAYAGRGRNKSSKPSALNAMAFLRRVVPSTVQYRAASLLGERIQDWVVNRSLTARRDWSATPSFPVLSGGEGLIRLNLKARESRGVFEADEAEAYVAWLCDRLSKIEVCATGEQLVRKITVADEQFPGTRREFLPDLILEWGPDAPVNRIQSPDIGVIEVALATGRGGNHNDEAFLIASGDAAFLESAARTEDVAALGAVAEEYFAVN